MFWSAMYFGDHLVRHVSRTATKVAPCPYGRPPNCFFRCGNSASRWCAVFPFSHCIKRLIVTCGGSEDQQMHVILRHMTFHDRYLVLSADVPDPDPGPLSPPRLVVPASGTSWSTPDAREFRIQCARRAVFRHLRSLSGAHALKPSPKGEGFNPPVRDNKCRGDSRIANVRSRPGR